MLGDHLWFEISGYALKLRRITFEQPSAKKKRKKKELIQRIRRTLLGRGQSGDYCKFKRVELLTLSFKALLMTSSRLQNLMNICETLIELLSKLTGNYKILKLTLDQKKKYLEVIEQQRIKTVSQASRRSTHASKKSKTESIGSKASSMSCVTGETFLLQKEEAALKAILAFVEEEQKIKMEQKKAKLIKE